MRAIRAAAGILCLDQESAPMSSAVTSTTITTISAIQIAGAFGLLIILATIAFFVSKEIVDTSTAAGGNNWSQALRVAIVPFAIAFIIILAINFTTVLS
jgi:heme/copper-type cytochrome/quinol oxidase subunit 2